MGMRNKKPFIIFVDDSPSAREIVKDEFKQANYLLKTASGVHELERMFNSDQKMVKEVDLFIFDFAMPEITGIQIASVIDRVYGKLKNVPFLIFSARPRPEVLKAISDAQNQSETFVRNFRGYVEKKSDSVSNLLIKINEVLK